MTQQTVNYRINNFPINITLLNQETPQTITQCLPVLNTRPKEVNNPLIFKGGFKDEVQLSITDGWVAEDV